MHLGTAYEDGVGVERSLAVAYAWFQCAIENASKKTSIHGAVGDTEAEILKDTKADLEKLSGDIAATDLEGGKILALEFIARYGKSGPNMLSSGRTVNRLPSLPPISMTPTVRYRAAQLWR